MYMALRRVHASVGTWGDDLCFWGGVECMEACASLCVPVRVERCDCPQQACQGGVCPGCLSRGTVTWEGAGWLGECAWRGALCTEAECVGVVCSPDNVSRVSNL